MYEPEIFVNYRAEDIVTTTAAHQLGFDKYVAFLESGSPKTELDIIMPSSTATSYASLVSGITDLGFSIWIYDYLKVNEGSAFILGQHNIVNVIFENGDKATFVVFTFYRRSAGVKLLIVVESDSNEIPLGYGGSVETITNGGGSVTGYFFTYPNVLVCWGSCPGAPETTIRITPG